jgi:amidase
VFGFRPSRGRVPQWPAQEGWLTQLGTEGPMGRTVRDVALLLETQAGYDARQPLSIAGSERFADALDEAASARIGWLADLDGYLPMEDGILALCESALQRLSASGHAVEATAPGFDAGRVWDAWLVWRRLLTSVRIASLLADARTVEKNRAQIKPEALWEYDESRKLTGPDLLSASATRTAFYQHLLSLFERFDFLALPSAQVWPFDAQLRWPARIGAREMDTYHRWMEVTIYATFAGLPCICVPAGFGPDGLPMGLQLIGRPQGDRDTLRMAAAFERVAQDMLVHRPAV